MTEGCCAQRAAIIGFVGFVAVEGRPPAGGGERKGRRDRMPGPAAGFDRN
jgi:hypothetical protein